VNALGDRQSTQSVKQQARQTHRPDWESMSKLQLAHRFWN
jgi:hypothetical protein